MESNFISFEKKKKFFLCPNTVFENEMENAYKKKAQKEGKALYRKERSEKLRSVDTLQYIKGF